MSTMEQDKIREEDFLLEHLKMIIKRAPDELISDDSGEEFESAEHENIGNKIKLTFPSTSQRSENDILSSTDKRLRLPNGLELNFGQIIALGGDFYGVPEKPIVVPIEDKESQSAMERQRQRFLDAYGTLACVDRNDVKKELDQILEIMTKERRAVEAVLEKEEGEKLLPIDDKKGGIRIVPKDVYEKLGNSLVKEWDEITGGFWIKNVPLVSGRMMKLAERNTDHFQPFAKDAYLTGHSLALEKAREASKIANNEKKLKLLEEAYSMDAFACHFLTDIFSSGHLRTPRYELGKQVTPSKIGHLLSKFMHDEDNKYGIRVTNERGDKWIAYGDGMLLNEESLDNAKIAVEAVQISVDQVFEAYLSPKKAIQSSSVTNLLPFIDPNEKNNYPMFQLKAGKVLRRADLDNLSDSTTVGVWCGLTTCTTLLSSYKPSQSTISEYKDDIDCRGCGQALNPKSE